MATKVIGVCLILSYLLAGVTTGRLRITEEQYAAFKGIDPAANCGNRNALLDICIAAGKLAGIKDFTAVEDYPQCQDSEIHLLKCDGKTTSTKTKILVCGWKMKKINRFYLYGKGQSKDHVMNYDLDMTPNADIPIKSTGKDD